ncbi:MAG TPA: beta-propeller fold lactonase family protein [Steroidobacteraceae bacterium]|nr:beta-propeller fold lactonase family protein [Steroidobacteraceae bacterium]HVC02660.1 beta-propeller fold lactonase family protein [Steroidobacteraceae bacterium]
MNRSQLQSGRIATWGLSALCLAALGSARTAAAYAYVGNQLSGTVSIIDTATDTVVRTLPAHGKIGAKIQAVVADRSERHIFVVDAAGNDLVELDAASGRVLKRIKVGKAPEGASLSPSGKTIAVCVEESNQVVLVDVASARVTHVIHTLGKNPEHCEFNSDAHWMMTGNENSGDVDIIDLRTDRSVARLPTAGHPRGVAWLPHRMIAYVAQESANGVNVIDAAKRRVIRFIPTALRAAGAIAAPDGKTVFVSNGGAGSISAIDTATERVIATIPVGKRPWNMAITHDGRKLYVANGRSNSVSVIDTTRMVVSKTIPVGKLPWGVDIP